MDLSREGIVEGLQRIVEPGDVITDEKILVASSVDNFRKLQNIFDVHTMPVPAAIVMARGTEQVAAILRFAGEHAINVIPRTGGTATEGGLESAVPDSIIIDGSAMNEIVNIDAHHDIHYGHDKIGKIDKPNCGSWGGHLMARGRVKSWLQVYPEWRRKIPEGYEDKFQWAKQHCNIDAIYGDPPRLWRKVDIVFVCRSGCWVPPEYDSKFTLFCKMLGVAQTIPERSIHDDAQGV